jgi:hypothetical protein
MNTGLIVHPGGTWVAMLVGVGMPVKAGMLVGALVEVGETVGVGVSASVVGYGETRGAVVNTFF